MKSYNFTVTLITDVIGIEAKNHVEAIEQVKEQFKQLNDIDLEDEEIELTSFEDINQ
jgi:hypothetical protein